MLRLVRGFPFREWLSGSRESLFCVCDRPCDPLSCLLFTALCLHGSHTLVMQETSLEQDDEPTCSLTSVLDVVTWLPIGPLSLVFPVSPFDRFENSCPSLPSDAPRVVLAAPDRSRWRHGALQTQPQILQRTTGWDGCGPFLSEGLRCITWNTRGLVGSVFSRQRRRESKIAYLKKAL